MRRPGRAGLVLLLLVAVCCTPRRPILLEVYPTARQIHKRPVIIIPGIFGSRLMDERTGEVVWGRLLNLLTSRFKLALTPTAGEETDLLDLPIDAPDVTQNRDHLVAYDLFDGVAGRHFYTRIIQTLTHVAGYRCGDIAAPQLGEDCFAFYYDWRRDIAENARLLGEAVDRVRAVHPAGEKVDLVAHSLGGLIARYYVKYGGRDVLASPPDPPAYIGAENVHTIVMIGVPNQGTLDTLEALNKGVRVVRALPPEAVFTMPAAYQTLPRGGSGPFIGPDGRPVTIDLFDPAAWEKHGWSVFAPERVEDLRKKLIDKYGDTEGHERFETRMARLRAYLAAALGRARLMTQALDQPGPTRDPVRYFAFGGDCTPTPARAMLLRDDDGRWRTIHRFDELPRAHSSPEIRRLMSEPGDGSVTRSSLLALPENGEGDPPAQAPSLDYTLFLCERHRHLTENITFQDNLLQFLLYRRR